MATTIEDVLEATKTILKFCEEFKEVVYISKTGDTYHKYSDCPRLQIAHGAKKVSLKSVKECMYHECPECY